MKAKIIALAIAIVASLSITVSAKDSEKQSVTFLVSMSCENCKKRIENTLSYEKGVKSLEVNLSRKTVTVEYDPKKTTADKLKAAIQDLGYTATVFTPKTN